MTLTPAGAGWAAGEGNALWRTRTAGRAWEPVKGPAEAPPGAADWRAVWADGNAVALCGSPGGAVFTGTDSPGGVIWAAGFTGQTAPLNAVAFSETRAGEPYGLAMGDLGAIVRTSVGPGDAAAAGWRAVRGGGRRAAILVVTADPAGVPLASLAVHAADGGHRAAVFCPVRRDVGAAAVQRPGERGRLRDAVLAAGANAAGLSHQFPLAVPGAGSNAAALAADWDRRLDADHAPVLRDAIARAVRTWRPTAVILDARSAPTGPADAAADLVRTAAEEALYAAADPTRLTDLDRLGLPPWRTARLLERWRSGEVGTVAVPLRTALPHLGGEAGDLAAVAASRLGVAAADDAFSVLLGGGTTPLSGVNLVAGGPARRPARPRLPEPGSTVRLKRRVLAAFTERVGRGEESSFAAPDQLAAHLRRLAGGLPRPFAAADQAALADRLLAAGELDAAEAVLVELLQTYPDQPAARAAAPRLLALWCGSERDRRRLAAPALVTTATAGDAVTLADGTVTNAAAVSTAGALSVGGGKSYRTEVRKERLRRAAELGDWLARAAPRTFADAGVRRGVAVARRDLGLPPAAGTAAIGDAGALTGALTVAAGPAPRLDGVLSDPCWLAAAAAALDPGAASAPGGLLTAATDGRFLFLAGALPAHPDHGEAPTLEGRAHDADLSALDRVEFSIDPDGDLGTAWNFAVARDGGTREDCCGDPSWDPGWFVEVVRTPPLEPGDPGDWRFEAAIPLDALSFAPPTAASAWAVRIRRVTPGVGAAEFPPRDPDATAVPVDADRPFARLRWPR